MLANQERLKIEVATVYRLFCFVFLASLFLAFSSADVQSEESPWPMFQHDAQRTGRSNFEGPQEAVEPIIFSTVQSPKCPVVAADGTIYITGLTYPKYITGLTYPNDIPTSTLFAIDSGGTVIWERPGPIRWDWGDVSLSPNGDIIYMHDRYYDIISAIDRLGNTLWETGMFSTNGGGRLAISYDGTIYFTTNGYARALSSDGDILWSHNFPWHVDYSTPVLPLTADTVYLNDIYYMYALNATNGEPLWSAFYNPWGSVFAVFAMEGDALYAATSETLSRIDKTTGESLWSKPIPDASCPAKYSNTLVSPAINHKGNIIAGSGRTVSAFTPEGDVLWSYCLRENEVVGASSIVIDSNNTAYFVTYDPVAVPSPGRLLALSSTGSLLWEYNVEILSNVCLALNNQTLFATLARDGVHRLYAFGSEPPPPPQSILTVTPDALDFGSVEVGSSKDLDFTVQNTGNGTLSGAASINMPFSIVAGGSFNLAAGESQTVTVRFSPTSSGTFVSSVTFTSNGGNASPVVQGEGVLPPHIDSLLPLFGPSGSLVTIIGYNFGAVQGSAVVNFNSAFATITFWSNTEIRAIVPSLSLGTYAVTVTTIGGTSNSISFLLTIPPTESDFRIIIAPSLQTVVKGSSTLYRVLIEAVNGFNKPVILTAIGLPPGTSAEFSPNPVAPAEGSDLIITTTVATPLGKYTFTIQGSANGLTHSTTAQLQVKRSKEAVLSLQRSFSSEKPLLLTFQYQKQTEDEITAVITLWNLTGTWVKATMNFEAGDHPVSVNEKRVPSVILLGPFASKSLGTITFRKGEFLQYDGERTSFEVFTALVIDLFLRGTLGHEVPPNFFFNLYSGGDLASNLAGDVFRAIGADCRDLGFRFGFDLTTGNATDILVDIAKFSKCMGVVKKDLQRLFTLILKDPKLAKQAAGFLDQSFNTIVELLQIPEHAVEFANLMCPSLVPPVDSFFESLGLCTTLGSPLNGFVRLEAVP